MDFDFQNKLPKNKFSKHETCQHIDAVSDDSMPCPDAEAFKRFIEATAKKYMPDNFDVNQL